MREIKFRAWVKNEDHPKGGEMFIMNPIFQVYDYENSGVMAFSLEDYDDFNCHEKWQDREPEWEIMQCVGQVYINGNKTDLYEGDIVRYDHEDGIVIAKVIHKENTGEDMWISGFAYEFIRIEEQSDEELSKGEPIGFEILGNIYENPELITN